MKWIADLHTHTVASGHGFSTLEEMAAGAKRNGIKYLGTTEHGPFLPGGPHLYYFYNLRVIPEFINGVRILKGAECNVAERDGKLDLPLELLFPLDLVWAGFHLYQEPVWTKEENTKAAVAALQNPLIDGIVHPGNPEFPMDHRRVLEEAKKQNKLIELNNASLMCRAGSLENCLAIARMAKELDLQVMVNSDAHISFDVGRHDRTEVLLSEAGLTEDNIINVSEERLQRFLQTRRKEKDKWREENEEN
ncbi:MAG: PHP domain-containing protein [bacterium]